MDLARREFGAEREVTARLAADLTRALYLAGRCMTCWRRRAPALAIADR